jgi:ABC-type ATPase with predicted acetyltransferase domain
VYILETSLFQWLDYRGNYDTFVKLRDANTKNAMRNYQAYQEKREHMMEFITKFRANAKRATMVQSRIKAVEKMDAEAPEAVEVDQVWRFNIPNSEPLGRPIISVDDVSFDYNAEAKTHDQYLLQKVNFGVDLDSKIAILGANGQGTISYRLRLTIAWGLVQICPSPTRHSVDVDNRKDYAAKLDHGQAEASQRGHIHQSCSANWSFYSTQLGQFRPQAISLGESPEHV